MESLIVGLFMNTMLVLDWGQTRHIANNPTRFHETNPILGEHPSLRKVDAYFLSSLAINNVLYWKVIPKKYRTAYGTAAGAWELGFVVRNNQIGIKFDF
jgi:hypothetical protein